MSDLQDKPTTQEANPYTARINRAIDYIDRNLDREIPLAELAKEACFSRFHFHRIFSAMVGETVAVFVRRLRVERAASLLRSHPTRSITAVAIDCGYSSSAVFARAFKQHFGMSASDWRTRNALPKADGARHITPGPKRFQWQPGRGRPEWRSLDTHKPITLWIDDLPPVRVAYVRHTGPYQGSAEVFRELFRALMAWAIPRGQMTPTTQVLTVFHDDPGVTDAERLRVSACITVSEDVVVGGGVGAMRLEGGQYAVGRFVLGEKEYAQAWITMMGVWLPESGYEPADRPCLERYLDDAAPSGKSVVELCVPVRPLQH